MPGIPSTATASLSVGSSLTITPGVETGTQERWLNAVPCRAPCWENITPGKNTPEQALELLKQVPGITGIEKSPEHPIATKPVAIYWNRVGILNTSGVVSYHHDPASPFVEYIKMPEGAYKLRDISKLYGEPSHIMAMLEFDELGRTVIGYDLYLVYLDQGLMLANKFSKLPAIASDTDFPEIYFFAPGVPGLSKIYGPRPELMVEWQGFKGFNYYCRRSTEAGTGNCDSVLNS
ncbi:MAG TPA: hypothetical protein VH186_11365 [Chloroflexia bacterium]|nr:hypothetical protein [Chloroflexia bacterium]